MARLSLFPPLPVYVASGKSLTINNTLTLAGVDGKTLTINASLVLAGTDATTMTFPASSTTVAGLSINETFTAPQTFAPAGTGSPITITAANMFQNDAGALRIHNNSGAAPFANPIFWIDTNYAFTAWFAYFQNNGTTVYQVFSGGAVTQNGTLTINGGSTIPIDVSGSGLSYFIKTGSLMTAGVSTGTGTVKLNTSGNANSVGLLKFQDSGGNTHLIPYW